MTLLFTLLVIYQLKHFFADYPLQTPYMLGKFKDKGWVLPLLAHVGVHGAFTLVITLVVAPHLWWLFLFDMVAHFLMDRLKAGKKFLGRYKALSGTEYMALVSEKMLLEGDTKLSPAVTQYRLAEIKQQFKGNVYFWWALGLDQMVHHLTHYAIIAALVLW
jgi:hypothetical protein